MNDTFRFIFWQKWLMYSCILFALWGILVAFAPDHKIFSAYHTAVSSALWQQKEYPAAAKTFYLFIAGPLGGTIAAFYLLAAFVCAYPFKQKERWARNAMVASFGAWAIIDSWICIKSGVFFQAYALNFFSVTVKALPIAFTWNDFKGKPQKME